MGRILLTRQQHREVYQYSLRLRRIKLNEL